MFCKELKVGDGPGYMALSRYCRVALLMCAIVVAGLAGCTLDTPTLVERAKKRMAEGNRDGAIVDLKSAVQQSPADGQLRYLLGRLYNETIDKPSAEKELVKARELGVVDGGALLVELARAYQAQNKWADLLKDVTPSDAFEAGNLASIHSLRGQAFLATGAMQKAQEALAAASAAAPGTPDVELLAVRLDIYLGNRQQARERVTAMLAKHPKNFEALMYLAGMSMAEGKLDETLKMYDNMLAIQPFHYGVLTNRSTILILQQKLDAAQKDVDVLRKIYKSVPPVFVQQGLLHLARGKASEALGAAEAALKQDPKDARAQLLAGLAHASLRSYEQAERSLTDYLGRFPRDLFARVSLARVLVMRGASTRAVELLSPLAGADVRDAGYWLVLADAHTAIGDQRKAASYYEKVLALDPSNRMGNVKLGLSLLAQDKTESGMSALVQAIEWGKGADVTSIDEVIVLAMLSRRQVDQAAAAVRKLLERAPKSAMANNLNGLVLQEQKMLDAARKAFEDAQKLDSAFLPAVRNLGLLDIASGKMTDARDRFVKFNERNKTNLDGMIAQAELELALGNEDAGIRVLRAAALAHPNAIEPKARLATLYMGKKSFDEANAIAEEALAAHPDRFETLLLAAETRISNNKVIGGIQLLQRLARDAPKSAQVQLQLGRGLTVAGRAAEAEAAFRKALEIRPRFTLAQIGLISSMIQGKRWDEALAFARTLQKADPKDSTGIVMEAEIAEARGEMAKAAGLYERAMNVQPGLHSALKLYQVRKLLGENATAQALLEEWLRRNPDQLVVRLTLAEDLAITGKLKSAIQHFELLTKHKDANVRAWNGLAWAYGQISDSRALPTAETALKMAPDSPMVKDTLGWLLVDKGDAKRGVDLLRQASAAKPDSAEIRYHLGIGYAKLGDSNAARKELQLVLDRHASSPQAKLARESLAALPAR
jgi:putative PEP-CTERM system TPR-repeat lipoprotein